MKFLVLWHFDLSRLGPDVARAVMHMPDYANKLAAMAEPGFIKSHPTKSLIAFSRCRRYTTMPPTRYYPWRRCWTR